MAGGDYVHFNTRPTSVNTPRSPNEASCCCGSRSKTRRTACLLGATPAVTVVASIRSSSSSWPTGRAKPATVVGERRRRRRAFKTLITTEKTWRRCQFMRWLIIWRTNRHFEREEATTAAESEPSSRCAYINCSAAPSAAVSCLCLQQRQQRRASTKGFTTAACFAQLKRISLLILSFSYCASL